MTACRCAPAVIKSRTTPRARLASGGGAPGLRAQTAINFSAAPFRVRSWLAHLPTPGLDISDQDLAIPNFVACVLAPSDAITRFAQPATCAELRVPRGSGTTCPNHRCDGVRFDAASGSFGSGRAWRAAAWASSVPALCCRGWHSATASLARSPLRCEVPRIAPRLCAPRRCHSRSL